MQQPNNQNQNKSRSSRPAFIIATIIVIIVIIVGVIIFAGKNSSNQTATMPSTMPVTTDTAASSSTSTSTTTYKDGTYTAVGTYDTPIGTQSINVSLTISNGIVTDSTVSQGQSEDDSRRYQQIFISNYKQYVIGKSLATLSLGKVSGSSLTPGGFNNALAQIKAQASV